MIAGQPGLGKTTLAHIIAKQCGYNIVEINARYTSITLFIRSDERSGEAIKQKITDAIENKRVDNMPNLVILDEIDGAANVGDRGLISFLVNLLKRESFRRRTVDTDAHDEDNIDKDDGVKARAGTLVKGKKSKKKKPKRLLRPIIIICNDPYHHSIFNYVGMLRY